MLLMTKKLIGLILVKANHNIMMKTIASIIEQIYALLEESREIRWNLVDEIERLQAKVAELETAAVITTKQLRDQASTVRHAEYVMRNAIPRVRTG